MAHASDARVYLGEANTKCSHVRNMLIFWGCEGGPVSVAWAHICQALPWQRLRFSTVTGCVTVTDNYHHPLNVCFHAFSRGHVKINLLSCRAPGQRRGAGGGDGGRAERVRGGRARAARRRAGAGGDGGRPGQSRAQRTHPGSLPSPAPPEGTLSFAVLLPPPCCARPFSIQWSECHACEEQSYGNAPVLHAALRVHLLQPRACA